MNIFELFIIIADICIGYYFGKLLDSWFGIIGQISGFIIGFLTPILLLQAYGANSGRNGAKGRLPKCKKGKCRSKDYKIVGGGEFLSMIVQCSCGTKYVKVRRQLLEMLEDGSTHPFMYNKGIFFAHWVPDENEKKK